MTQGMRFEITTHGLEGLRRMSGLAPEKFNVVLKDAVRVSAIQMRFVMIEEVGKFAIGGSGGRLAQSVRYRLRGLQAEIGSMAPTALSIEKGRSVGEVVPIGLILRWVKTRGIVRGVFAIGSQTLLRRVTNTRSRIAGVNPEELREASRIVALIRQHGTHPKLFAERTVERSKDRVLRNFRDSTAKAMRGLAQLARAA